MKEFNYEDTKRIREGLYLLSKKIFQQMEENNFDDEDLENEYYKVEELYDYFMKLEDKLIDEE